MWNNNKNGIDVKAIEKREVAQEITHSEHGTVGAMQRSLRE